MQQEGTVPSHKHFSSLWQHHLCDGPIGQSMSHDQAQGQCGRDSGGPGHRGCEQMVTIYRTGNSRLLFFRKAEPLPPG